MERRTFMTRGLAVMGSLGLAGCNHYYGGPPPHAPAHGRRHGGPPPHAPAHGHRHRHHRSGVDLVFDSGLGVYVVAGLGHYFYGGKFYRWRNDVWQVSVNVRGPWHGAHDYEVPRRLFKSKVKAKGKYKYKGKGRGKGKFKGKSIEDGYY
jgi:hypothetical protein